MNKDGTRNTKHATRLVCTHCRVSHPFDPSRVRCDCGGVIEVEGGPTFDPARTDKGRYDLWRYLHAIPLPAGVEPVTLGEGWTPLLPARWKGVEVLLKCEFLNPTGSFKDRGTTVMVTGLAGAGVDQVVEDSSGNAGSSLAAYGARAGIRAAIYIPAYSSPAKKSQIAAYGATLVPIPGPRQRAAQAVLEAAKKSVYASHVYHPLIQHGMKTVAFELYEQLGGRADLSIILPVGHGSLLLGLARGFAELAAAGCISRLPRLFGVQAAACAPLAAAWERGAAEPLPVEEKETIAEGVRIAVPVRGRAILAAVRESGGEIIALPDTEVEKARLDLAHQGFYVEPTSALAVAALDHLHPTGQVVAVLTGSGFKAPAKYTIGGEE